MIPARELKIEALASISASFERLCLAAGLEALGEMMEADAQTACGPRHGRGKDRTAHRWGKTKGKIGFHGGKVEIARPRLRSFDGKEQALPSWEGAMTEDWLGKWAMNQMLINVSTRKFERSMRLPEGDVPAPNGSGLSKSAASRRFVALSAARLAELVDQRLHFGAEKLRRRFSADRAWIDTKKRFADFWVDGNFGVRKPPPAKTDHWERDDRSWRFR